MIWYEAVPVTHRFLPRKLIVVCLSHLQSSDEREFRTARDYTASVAHAVRSKALPRKQVANEHDPTLNQPDKGLHALPYESMDVPSSTTC